MKDLEEVYFHNDSTLHAHIVFRGDKNLFKANGNNAGAQDMDPTKSGEILTGKRKGKDRTVYYDVFMSKKSQKRRRARGNGTIKIGQTA